MTELHTETLPLLPLTTGVVLPGMVVTLTIESPRPRRRRSRPPPTASAPGAQDRGALRPRRHRSLRSRRWAGPRRGRGRRDPRLAPRGRGRRGARDRLGDLGPDRAHRAAEPSSAAHTSSRASTARRWRTSLSRVASRRSRSSCVASPIPGQIADMAGYSPDLSFERKVEVLETVDVEARLEKVLAWAKDTLAEVEVKERIRDEVSENLEKRQREMILREQMAAIRKELGEEGVDDWSTSSAQDREAGDARRGPRAGRARARTAGAHLRPVARVRVDPDVPRLADRGAVGRPHRGQPGHRRGAHRARRRPRGPRRREGPDPRVPGGAEAPARARPRRGDRPWVGRDLHAGRPTRRR